MDSRKTRKTTIFRQLIFNIAIPTLLALLAFAVINFQHTRSILVNNYEEKNKIISDEVFKIIEFQDVALKLIDDELNSRLKTISFQLVKNVFANTSNIKGLDLVEIKKRLGMDPENEDIYIVSKDGIVINTTFKQDLNLNLFSFGDQHKNYLLNVFNSGTFNSELFAIEYNTRRLRKYTYQPTLDKNYIVELGAYSKKADDVNQKIEETKDVLKNENEWIIDIELWLMADQPFSMNKDATEIENHKGILLNTFLNRRDTGFLEKYGDLWYHYQYTYLPRKETKLYKEAVIRIISDRTAQKALLGLEVARFIVVFILTMLLLSILIYRKTLVITLPIKKLVENVNRITNGNLRERAEVIGNNEITSLSEKFNMMIAQLESYYYELEEKVKERTIRIEKQKEEISQQRDALAEINSQLNVAYSEIEDQKKHIMDSIYYARRIQSAILPSLNLVGAHFKNYFVFYLPKDIVSGDFYWMNEADGLAMISAVDCTGHGVPGAFMSIVGFNQLNNAINVTKARRASDILNELNRGVILTLNENTSDTSIKDGMDLALCVFDFPNKKVEFSGANNPMILIRDNKFTKYKGNNFPIGAFEGAGVQLFTNHEIDIKEGDCIYLFSDGYADQFGGPDNKKFFSKRFEELLFEIHAYPMEDQKEMLRNRLFEWMGNNAQVDDILVIGIKI